MKNQFLFYFLIMLSLLSCKTDNEFDNSDALLIINEVLDIMEENSVRRKIIDWTDFRNKVLNKAETAQTIQQTYSVIKEALVLLDDNHSYFKKPDGGYFSGYTWSCNAEDYPKPTRSENVGYVRVNMFSGYSNSQEAITFAEEIQNQIKTADHSNIIGWIVDLRGNSGGNMWPMLAGIGPILGEGIAGYFIDPENNQTSWGYKPGSSIMNGNSQTQLSMSYKLIKPNPRVAVLLDKAVASSGETIAIGFIGREDSKNFGSYTCGQTTEIVGFNLNDGSTLGLAISHVADRKMNKYAAPIVPDMFVSNEDLIQKALEWIES